jgi:hypothetical protein
MSEEIKKNLPQKNNASTAQWEALDLFASYNVFAAFEDSNLPKDQGVLDEIKNAPEQAIENLLESEMLVALARSNQLFKNAQREHNPHKIEMYLKYADKFQCRVGKLAETIMKIRRPDQKITIERINVSGDAKALIGNVSIQKSQKCEPVVSIEKTEQKSIFDFEDGIPF